MPYRARDCIDHATKLVAKEEVFELETWSILKECAVNRSERTSTPLLPLKNSDPRVRSSHFAKLCRGPVGGWLSQGRQILSKRVANLLGRLLRANLKREPKAIGQSEEKKGRKLEGGQPLRCWG
jgi:hypothetical protein